jgi:hypothetical protein
MYDEDRQKIVTGTLDMVESLVRAINEAGGYVSLEEMRMMTLEKLISHMCTNGIRFIFIPPKKE